MGFWKDLIGIDENDDDDELDEIEEVEEVKKERKPLFQKREKIEETEVKKDLPQQQPSQRPQAQRQASSTMPKGRMTSEVKMIVIKPQSFEESPKLVDSLKAKKPVIINLEDLETDVARKIFDFLSGATYALNGKVQKIANNIFLFSPENVDVSYADSSKRQAVREEAPKSVWD